MDQAIIFVIFGHTKNPDDDDDDDDDAPVASCIISVVIDSDMIEQCCYCSTDYTVPLPMPHVVRSTIYQQLSSCFTVLSSITIPRLAESRVSTLWTRVICSAHLAESAEAKRALQRYFTGRVSCVVSAK